MDPHSDSSLRNPLRLDGEVEKSSNCNGSAKQKNINDNDENVFTSASHATDSTSSTQKGPSSKHINYSTNESTPPSSRSSENSSERNKNVSGSNHSSYRNNSFADVSEAASSSKTDSNCCDGDLQGPQRYKVCVDKASNICNMPSTSGNNRDTENVNCRENRKRPSSLKLNKTNLDDENSSSDTGNDDYSLGSDDGCIYTYRGGQHLADLPSSFFSLDMGLPLDRHLPTPPNYQAPAPAARDGSRASSPDMDFLEMDFDPGPSCEVDTGDESTPDADLEEASNMPEENEPVIKRTSPEYLPGPSFKPPVPVPIASGSREPEVCYSVPSTSRGLVSGQGDVKEEPKSRPAVYGPFISHVNAQGEKLVVRRTMSHWPTNTPVNLHVSSGDLVSPREILNYDDEHTEGSFTYQINQGERPAFDTVTMSSTVYHLNMAKKLIGEKEKLEAEDKEHDTKMVFEPHPEAPGSSTTETRCVEPPRCMIWSEREACERQVTQIGTSACGATAVVNVFIALGVPINLEQINAAVGTRQRANNAPVPRYLLSRAVAGCTAADLVNGIQKASDGLVTARFFPTHPERAVSLSHWLADWIALGAVPILTLNLQVACEGEIPDAWHHQMVFGVSPRGVFLCNPVECVRESTLWPRLTSSSVLLVRTRDVIARFTPETDLTPLMFVPDRRFHTFNVLGQVANVIREWRASGWSEQGTRTHHIRIPAAYQAGVTVAALTGTEAHRRLMHIPQLPIVNPQDPA
ncbi:uncharacterized protein LOC128677944 [Plodia interpunctella]|uniref:uncharacterized protein LOC128677944 n=1 Tax=Plodia interpunctella TaxID=58824 RepID=UPI0023686982|nr:uncharacterized protein LOC128677944 [Plodia interpunctella]